MIRIFPPLSLKLLQNNIQYFKKDDPQGAAIVLVCFGAVVGIVLILNLVKNSTGSSGLNKQSGTASRRFSRFALFRAARYYHLNRKQAKVLGEILRTNGVSDPFRVMRNPDLIDRCFKRTYNIIYRTAENDEETQQKITQLFSLRNVLDVLQGGENSVSSTTQIAEHTKAILNTLDASYPVQVVSSKGENLVLECPKAHDGVPLQLNKGAKVTLSGFTQSRRSFSFDTKVMETTNTAAGSKLALAHSFQVNNTAVRRKFRRKQIAIHCFYYSIRIEETKVRFKKKQKMVVSRKKIAGTITDISIGGCAMRASVPLAVGSRLKIEIEYSRERGLVALGQVMRINQGGSMGTVLYIKFLKVPRRTWNIINAVVFDYNDG
jgi:hypothetical protein